MKRVTAPSKSTFMVNYRVETWPNYFSRFGDEGCDVLEKMDDSEYGKFGWVMDPEGTRWSCGSRPRGSELRA